MNMLASLQIEDGVVVEAEQDRVGGSRTMDSDIYTFIIEVAFTDTSKVKNTNGVESGGARFVTLHLKDKKTGTSFKPTVYVTGGKDKGCKPYYTKKDDATGKETNYPLPGFSVANGICELTTGVPLAAQELEEKVVKIYDFDAKTEKPTKVQALVGLSGKEVKLGVLRITEDKNKSDGNGGYAATGETRDINEIDKVFCAREDYDNMTQTEIKDKKTDDTIEAVFYKTWLEANQGKTRNKSKNKSTAGAPGKPAASAAAGKPKSGLFS